MVVVASQFFEEPIFACSSKVCIEWGGGGGELGNVLWRFWPFAIASAAYATS